MTLMATNPHLQWGSPKGRIKAQSITQTKQDTHKKHLLYPGSGCPLPYPYSQKDPALTVLSPPKMATQKEGKYFSLANLFLYSLIRIVDLVNIASTVFSCKGDIGNTRNNLLAVKSAMMRTGLLLLLSCTHFSS